MDWDDLRVFLAVARGESLSAAARRLKIDAATVGRRVARLEEALGGRLFTRSPQGYELTGAGLRLMPHAEAAEAAARAGAGVMTGEGAEAESGIGGLIRLGAPDGCANFLLPQVLARICDAHPALEVQLVALPRVFNLSKREADMAIGVSRPETGRLVVQKLVDYRLVLAASSGWLAAHPPIRTRADLKAHRIVGYIPDLIFDRELDYLAGIGAPGAVLSSNSASVQVNMLRHGAGVGIVHDFALPHAPELRRVLAEEVELTRAFWLIRHADDARVARLSRFAELLLREARAEMAALAAA
ncbi:LysR family transcriptional regulator [Pseudogemmobacter sonorensis]|uniref:LysR family transcriptional regulator n=1 Tax=Pseudogemmobacter sonorensis TaxID=2989681 RepID=UPI0036AB5BA4